MLNTNMSFLWLGSYEPTLTMPTCWTIVTDELMTVGE